MVTESGELLRGYKSYRLFDDRPIYYDPERHLPPDVVSINLGFDAATAAAYQRLLVDDPSKPLRVLIPGVGPGTMACSFMACLDKHSSFDEFGFSDNINIDAFDINPDAVATASDNMRRFAQDLDLDYNVFQGDWRDPTTWEKLATDGYHIILANPPYLDQGEKVRQGYENVPKDTMYVDNEWTEHYETLAQQLPKVLVAEAGTVAIMRMPVEMSQIDVEYVYGFLNQAFQNDPRTDMVSRLSVTELLDKGERRFGSWAEVQRGFKDDEATLLTFRSKRVRMALDLDLGYIPTWEEYVQYERLVRQRIVGDGALKQLGF